MGIFRKSELIEGLKDSWRCRCGGDGWGLWGVILPKWKEGLDGPGDPDIAAWDFKEHLRKKR